MKGCCRDSLRSDSDFGGHVEPRRANENTILIYNCTSYPVLEDAAIPWHASRLHVIGQRHVM